jgi:hypothetical protein
MKMRRRRGVSKNSSRFRGFSDCPEPAGMEVRLEPGFFMGEGVSVFLIFYYG